MLQSIEIENFRCFRHSRFENFGQVNLIGGKNNAGKTALLEAIFLMNNPNQHGIRVLQDHRVENPWLYIHYADIAWENFFYQQNKTKSIGLVGVFDEDSASVKISCVEIKNLYSGEKKNGEFIRIEDSEKQTELSLSRLDIYSESKNGTSFVSIPHSYIEKPTIIISPETEPKQKTTFLVQTGFRANPVYLARELDKTKLNGDTNHILEAFRLIDDSIEKIDTINLGEPRIYIFRKNEKPQPLNFFGDALNKIADLILRVSNNPNCILLIDEIENGIHYTNQQEFWQMLIKLAVAKDVQIFATSHSEEMIHAFQSAAVSESQEGKVRFIEMYRSQRTGEIVGDSVDMETLAFDIQNNNPYRGEE